MIDPKNAWVALVHHPVYDKHHKVVATALTNLDLHDIARSTRTYELAGFLIVHPVSAQRELAQRIADHWMTEGAEKNDFRRMAIARVSVVSNLDEARAHVTRESGSAPKVIATSARPAPHALAYSALGPVVGAAPHLLLFGTGWGLTDEIVSGCDHRLAPLQGNTDYNHLSVRSACAIILDRLYGDRED